MFDAILAAEPTIRLVAFLGVLAAMALWEVAAPRRRREIPRVVRWTNNLALVVLDTAILRLTFPILAVGLAVLAEERGWGLFNNVDVPVWVAVVVSMLLLDLAIYLQHVMFHAVPGLWRLHRMHHADLDFDATTGLRFHPVEILISMGIKLAVVAALGPPAIAVLLFEVILNATALFNHANINLPRPVDRILRWIVVTPDMHRVHHSIDPRETNSNFGFNLPWWDRLLGTYVAQPVQGHTEMVIGIEQFRTSRDLWLDRMLIQPLRGPASGGVLDARSHEVRSSPISSKQIQLGKDQGDQRQ
ncbi:sterol desaturase/sphingolipid hydroxylase (fatty acid hydroxylase superfamily) [Loktanella sp. PT4BL]|jgi:sterol desaturase/sphingolipid hydroxylase (fatty acid hydroxylase superfamily)|uniref:sterol desaturase family protein n=1 Tax=Loktanella sp. PT4BL TaxID=2135611 RepID=UPI000D77244A|nr:sterol desaturase family protein [Loktanella sp. PT4BL]PXW66432.1 sterol desaturase/sphingolipid hydroxylase (fatty acid hydroxylase superfamily) [Loktanella sp. PT4BL]